MGTKPIPDWLLERLAAGDLPEAEADALRRRLDTDADGAARLAAIPESNRAILERHPPARVAASIRTRADGTAQRRVPRGFAWALAAVLFVSLRQGPPAPIDTQRPEEIRLKGAEPKLLVHRSERGTPVQLADGAKAGAHDLLQLSYQAAGQGWGVVLSVDGNGNVVLHLPDGGPTAARLERGGAVSLPQSYELDDAPRFERFVLVTSDAPFAVQPVLDAARWLAASSDPLHTELPLPGSLRQTSFLVEKVP